MSSPPLPPDLRDRIHKFGPARIESTEERKRQHRKKDRWRRLRAKGVDRLTIENEPRDFLYTAHLGGKKSADDGTVLSEGQFNSVIKQCPQCKRNFRLKPAHAERFKYCGMRCRTAHSLAREFEEAFEYMAALSKNGVSALTPAQASKMRARIAQVVGDGIEKAAEVLAGDRKWDQAQARIFSNLLNKVVPDLSASYVQQEITRRDIKELSVRDLQAIVAGFAEAPAHAHHAAEPPPALEHLSGGAGADILQPRLDAVPAGEAGARDDGLAPARDDRPVE